MTDCECEGVPPQPPTVAMADNGGRESALATRRGVLPLSVTHMQPARPETVVKGLEMIEKLQQPTLDTPTKKLQQPTLDTPTTAATYSTGEDQITTPETLWRTGHLSSLETSRDESAPSTASCNASESSFLPQTTLFPDFSSVEVAPMPQSQVVAKAYEISQLKHRKGYAKADVDPMKRMVQVFSAKLVLEVFGGAGAIWGFSEVCTFRRTETQEFWRTNAYIFGAIFAVRWLMQIRDYMVEVGGSKINLNEGSMKRIAQIFSARLVLEVCGGGGAIWGFSEVCTLRSDETQEFWRYNACVIALIFLVRWCLQMREYVFEHNMRFTSTKECATTFESQLYTEKTALTSQQNANVYGI